MKSLKEAREPRITGVRAGEPKLTARVLGSPMFSVGGTPLRLPSRKARGLLGYLVLGEPGPQARERLVGLFWSEVSEDNARASLRQIVHEIRQAFRAVGFEGFHSDKQSITLNPGQVSADLTEIVAAADAGMPHHGIIETRHLPESLLEGLDTIDPAFGAWIRAKRQTLHDRLVRGLEAGLRSVRDPALRESIANAVIHLDSSHEEACRILIKSRADRSDFGGALRLYKGLWDLLADEFDVEPSIETQELVVAIRNGMSAADQAAAFRAIPEPEIPGMADHAPVPATLALPTTAALTELQKVRPAQRNMIISVGNFDASGTAPDQRYVVQGFRHELVGSLVRFREWVVRDDTVSGQERAPGSDNASEYRVDATAVTGADNIRLILTLRDAQSGVYIWSDRYAITLASWHSAQQAIIRKIAVTLNVYLSSSRMNRLSNEPDVSLDVFDRWLRAQGLIQQFKPDDWPRAEEIFRSTVIEAPNFSPGYSSLVQMRNGGHIVHPGVFRNAAGSAETLELARTAVQLDPLDSRAQLCLGWAHVMAGQYANAELHIGLAADLNENDPWTLISTALFYAFTGAYERAKVQSQRAMEASTAPTATHWVYQSTIEFLCEEYDKSISSSLASGDMIPSNIAWRAAAQSLQGQQRDAAASLKLFLDRIRRQWIDNRTAERHILQWLLHLYPIRDVRAWHRLRDGLKSAGGDVEGIEFGRWPN